MGSVGVFSLHVLLMTLFSLYVDYSVLKFIPRGYEKRGGRGHSCLLDAVKSKYQPELWEMMPLVGQGEFNMAKRLC